MRVIGIGMFLVTIFSAFWTPPPPTDGLPEFPRWRPQTVVDIPMVPADALNHPQSVDSTFIESILEGSPAAGSGQVWIDAGLDYDIDAAFLLAMFLHESQAGRDRNWVGWKDNEETSHNPGNIRCAGYASCYKGFRDYPSWTEGIQAMFLLVKQYEVTTIREVIETWAPPSENDTERYVTFVETTVARWRSTSNFHPNPDALFDTINCDVWGFQTIAQGFPQNCQHGGVDMLAPDGTPVKTFASCVFTASGEYTDPSHRGQYWMCQDGDIEWYYGHLMNIVSFTVGDIVPAGTAIGYIANGMGHTHVQVKDRGVLVDPLKYM